jgi:DNA-binding CsgD family transcriptional regulator
MKNLSEQDYQKILTFLHGLYTPDCLSDFSACISTILPCLIKGDVVGYCRIDFSQNQFLDGDPLPSLPYEQVKQVIGEHFHEHPMMAHYVKTRDPGACKLSDFVSEQQLHCMEGVYHKFLQPMGMEDQMVVTLPTPQSNSIEGITLFREERSFTERDRTILNLLQPHLLQARQTAQSFTQLQQTQQKLQDCLDTAGSIVMEQEARIHTMTKKAERLLKQYFHDFEHFSRSLPERLKQWVKYQRSLLTSQNGSLKPLSPLRVEQGNKLLNVRFAADPTKDQYLLLLSEQKRPVLSAELLETLGLSYREAEVLFLVMDGKTNPEIASALYLSISTVRKHLEHIYFKLGVQTRAAAVVAAFKKLGVLSLDWSQDD